MQPLFRRGNPQLRDLVDTLTIRSQGKEDLWRATASNTVGIGGSTVAPLVTGLESATIESATMNLNLKGQRALVCGASKGLGFACAQALAEEGADVVLVSRNERNLYEAATRIEQITDRRPTIVASDLAKAYECEKLAANHQGVDILVTNAGGPAGGDFRSLTRQQWLDAFGTNCLSAVTLISGLIDSMMGQSFGRIVNITSMTVKVPVQKLDLSNATRLALTGFVAGVARQVAGSGVTINNLLPGTIMTERLAELGSMADGLIGQVPAGRAGKPEEFGAACAFLCGSQAAYITGQNILIDGGLCALTV